MNDTIDQAMEIKALRDKIEELERQVAEYEKTLEEYGIDEVSKINDVEYICVQEIKKLKVLSDNQMLGETDTKILDTLHKNLRMARGELTKKEPKGKQKSVAELLKIVDKSNG